MHVNEGTTDRIIRLSLAVLLLGLALGTTLPAWADVTLYVAVGLLTLTGLMGICPLYSVLGINTCPVNPKRKA